MQGQERRSDRQVVKRWKRRKTLNGKIRASAAFLLRKKKWGRRQWGEGSKERN